MNRKHTHKHTHAQTHTPWTAYTQTCTRTHRHANIILSIPQILYFLFLISFPPCSLHFLITPYVQKMCVCESIWQLTPCILYYPIFHLYLLSTSSLKTKDGKQKRLMWLSSPLCILMAALPTLPPLTLSKSVDLSLSSVPENSCGVEHSVN